MAAYYGEIMLPSSRAVDEDEDEDEVQTITSSSPYAVTWTTEANSEIQGSGCLKCANLVIAIGPAPTGFVEAFVIGEQETERLGVVCPEITDNTANTVAQTASADNSCCVYRLKQSPDAVLVQCNLRVFPEQAFSWTQGLMSQISGDVQQVTVLNTCPAAEFKSDYGPIDINPPFLRSLKTTKFSDKLAAHVLEQPNTVSGLAAQVLSHCEIHAIPAVLYQCSTDTMYLDIHTIKAFCPILKSPKFSRFIKENASVNDKLRELVDQQTKQNSLLYI